MFHSWFFCLFRCWRWSPDLCLYKSETYPLDPICNRYVGITMSKTLN